MVSVLEKHFVLKKINLLYIKGRTFTLNVKWGMFHVEHYTTRVSFMGVYMFHVEQSLDGYSFKEGFLFFVPRGTILIPSNRYDFKDAWEINHITDYRFKCSTWNTTHFFWAWDVQLCLIVPRGTIIWWNRFFVLFHVEHDEFVDKAD